MKHIFREYTIPAFIAAVVTISIAGSVQAAHAQPVNETPYWWLYYNIGDESDDSNLYPFFADYNRFNNESPEELEEYKENFLELVDQRGTALGAHECYIPITIATSEACMEEYGPFVPFARLIDSEGEFADNVNELVFSSSAVNATPRYSYTNPNFFTTEPVTYADFTEPEGTANYIPDGQANPYRWLADPSIASQLNAYNEYYYNNNRNYDNRRDLEDAIEEISYTGLPAVSADAIRERFDRVAEESFRNRYTNESFAEASWDIQSYVAHPCFNVAGYEVVDCMRQFGANYNLKDLLLSKELDDILAVEIAEAPGLVRLLDAAREEVLLNTTLEELSDPLNEDLTNNYRYSGTLRSRAQAVWDYCDARYDYNKAVLCYAENDRFYLDPSVPFVPTYSDL